MVSIIKVVSNISTLLFGPRIADDKVIGLYDLQHGELALNLNDDILAGILATPEPMDDIQKSDLETRISACTAGMKENNANLRELREKYATMPPYEVMRNALSAIRKIGNADFLEHNLLISTRYPTIYRLLGILSEKDVNVNDLVDCTITSVAHEISKNGTILPKEMRTLQNELLHLDPEYRQYEADQSILKAESNLIVLVRKNTLTLMDLNHEGLSYALSKVYLHDDGSSSFKGSVRLQPPYDTQSGLRNCDHSSAADRLAASLRENGLQVEENGRKLLIDGTGSIVPSFYRFDTEISLARIDYLSKYPQLGIDALERELLLVQKVFQVAGREING